MALRVKPYAFFWYVFSTFLSALSVLAEETISLGDGGHFIVDEYLTQTIKDNAEVKLLVKGKSDFQPENFGPTPADFFVRKPESLCENLVMYSWASLSTDDQLPGCGNKVFRQNALIVQ